MIYIKVVNTDPYLEEGMAVKELSPSLPPIIVQSKNDTCICDYIACDYTEKVFAEDGGADYKNDHSEFLFKRLLGSDTVVFSLLKNGVEVDTLVNDDCGQLFDGFSSGTDEQQLYIGYRLDWEKILVLYGSGQYKLKATLTILGEETTFESRKFHLLPYSDLNANGTVKIESTQNGNIFGGEFDYTGLNWKQYIRIPAKFGNPTPIFEETKYTTTDKNTRQIKSKVSREWDLTTKLISWEVAEKLIYNKVMANEILITDYDIKAENVWRNISVRTESIEKPVRFGVPHKNYNIKFVDSKLIFEKTNY